MRPQLRHPDVKALAQGLLDGVQRGIRPQLVDRTTTGGGSPNMQYLAAATDEMADPKGHRAPLIAALAAQEQQGLFCWFDGCEQGVGTPHCELHLTVHGTLLLNAARTGDAEILGYEQRLFSGLYAISIAATNARGQVFMPGARQEDLGPHSVVLDAVCGVIGGRISRFPFPHIWRDNCAPWCLLEALKLKPGLFADASRWTLEDCAEHWYRLRWPYRFERFAGGLRGFVEVPPADAGQMGNIGSDGRGTSEIAASDQGGVAWRIFGGDWSPRGALDPAADLGELRATVRAAA